MESDAVRMGVTPLVSGDYAANSLSPQQLVSWYAPSTLNMHTPLCVVDSSGLTVFVVVDCSDTYDYGCDGGVPVYAYYYTYKAGGIELNQSYPYVSYWGDDSAACESNSDSYSVRTSYHR
jgi:hypothetical protein